jgi:Uma2 family endonuclease
MLARADGTMTRVLDASTRVGPTELPARRRFTRQEYQRLGELGLFEGERLELIDGEIVCKMTPQHSPHAAAIRRVEEALRAAFGQGFDVRVQLPLALAQHSEPEPDVSVVAGSFADYEREHPASAVLVVEVADSTLRFDRSAKASLYAAAEIPEYWIVNLAERVVELHSEPRPDASQRFGAGYGVVRSLGEGDSLQPTRARGEAIRVSDLLPVRR